VRIDPAGASARQRAAWAAVLTVLFEAITLGMRMGLDVQSTRDTAWLARFTFGLRIHHSYIGAALLVAAALVQAPSWRHVLQVLGAALVASDLIHHFAVLWPLTGSPHFDLVYPEVAR
jgi:hypothetical protein